MSMNQFNEISFIMKNQNIKPEKLLLKAGKSLPTGNMDLTGPNSAGHEAAVNSAKKQGLKLLPIKNFKAIKGKGVKATVSKKNVMIGTKQLMKENKIRNDYEEEMIKLESEGKTTVLVAINKKIVGIVAVADALKPDSIAAIKKLHEMGLKTAMITGDNERTAKAIAKKVGIDSVMSEVLPEKKVYEIK